jgi:GNAT superfamily N-acetyltransferase
MKRISIRTGPVGDLARYAAIPSGFSTDAVLDANAGVIGVMAERALESTFVKDYDALEPPENWPRLFDVSHWAQLSACMDSVRVGGAIVASKTPDVDMLENRRDLLVLWDIRVDKRVQGMGVGRALFEAAQRWGAENGCIELKVETQNVNIAACRFYRAMGCALATVNCGAYAGFPDETQLIWRKSVENNIGI